MAGDVITRAARGLAVREAAGIGVRVVGGFATLAIIGPAEAGLAATATAVVAVLVVVAQCGADVLLVRAAPGDGERRAQEVLATLLAITAAVGGLTALGCGVATWRGAPRLVALVGVLALSVPLNVLWAPAQATMERGLQFGRLGALELAGDATQHAVAVVVALRLHSAWASVIGQLTSQAVLLVGSYALAGLAPRPRWCRRTAGEVLAFGARSVPASLTPRAGDALSLVVVGWVLGPAAAGYVALCARMVDAASSGIRVLQRVALPVIARARAAPEAQRAALRRGALASATVGLVPFVVLCLVAGSVVPLLGVEWRGAVAWLPWACLPVVLGAPFALHAASLVATGRERVVLRSSLVGLVLHAAALGLVVPAGRTGWGIARLSLVVAPLLQARWTERSLRAEVATAVRWSIAVAPLVATAAQPVGLRIGAAAPLAVALLVPRAARTLVGLRSAAGSVADPVHSDRVDVAGVARWGPGHDDHAIAELRAAEGQQ